MKTKALATTALFAALILIATAYLKMPIAFGYVHAGDIFLLLACYFLPPVYAIPAAALGSMLADLLAGYVNYMPVTLVAKALMAALAGLFFYKDGAPVWKAILGAVLASVVMVACYFVFEGFYYGWAVAAANIPAQLLQPAISVPIAVISLIAFKKVPYLISFKSDLKILGKRSPSAKNGTQKVGESTPVESDEDEK